MFTNKTVLKSVVLLSKNVGATSAFFTEIIGLKLVHMTPDNSFAELRDGKNFAMTIRQSSEHLAKLQYGYAPIL